MIDGHSRRLRTLHGVVETIVMTISYEIIDLVKAVKKNYHSLKTEMTLKLSNSFKKSEAHSMGQSANLKKKAHHQFKESSYGLV